MRIKIMGPPLAQIKVNIPSVKQSFCEGTPLSQAVKQNTTIEELGRFTPDYLKDYAWLGLNWEWILDLSAQLPKKDMTINFFRVEYENKPELSPGKISSDGRDIIFETKTVDGDDVIMTNDFVGHAEYDLKCFLNGNTYRFGNKKWTLQ